MTIHEEVLATARRIGRDRKDWTFRPDEIVRALPHLNAGTIRTHVTSRCCVNAPSNHPHKWDYFTRLSRGVYEIRAKYRTGEGAREERVEYVVGTRSKPLRTIRCTLTRSAEGFRAECIDSPVVARGATLDDAVANLRDALTARLQGDETATLAITLEEPLAARHSISTLVRRITARNRHSETDWGRPAGREAW
jgi:antitoxin component of MazEF toxin-antitoxin module